MSRYIDAEWLLGVAKLSNGVVDIDDIYNAPTIDVVSVVHGEWMKTSNDWIDGCCGERLFPYHCSCCGYKTWDDELTNYCPNCGAKMKMVENERDYERTIEQIQHDMLYELTYNPEDGSM